MAPLGANTTCYGSCWRGKPEPWDHPPALQQSNDGFCTEHTSHKTPALVIRWPTFLDPLNHNFAAFPSPAPRPFCLTRLSSFTLACPMPACGNQDAGTSVPLFGQCVFSQCEGSSHKQLTSGPSCKVQRDRNLPEIPLDFLRALCVASKMPP